jgi:hypothetical protein
MGCGSPLGDLFYLADSLLYRGSGSGWWVRSDVPSYAAPPTPPEGLRAQLYQMYGEGQISEEVFKALQRLADSGQLQPADLAVHRSRAQRRFIGHDDPAVSNALRGIRLRQTQLAQARSSSEKVLADLEVRMSDIDRQVGEKEQAARDIVDHDEEAARQRLAEKAELSLSQERLVAQVQALRTDINRLDDLQAQLKTRALELEAVQARSRLNEEMLK